MYVYEEEEMLKAKTNGLSWLLFGLSAPLSVSGEVNRNYKGLTVGEWVLCVTMFVHVSATNGVCVCVCE